jgi:hypothetical protein
LISSDLRVWILGPDNRRVNVEVALSATYATGIETTARWETRVALPLSPDEWRRRITAALDQEQSALEEASSATVTVSADELGKFTLQLNRHLKPLRWSCRQMGDGTWVRLIDDTGGDITAAIECYPLKTPSLFATIPPRDALAGLHPHAGGLLIARAGQLEDLLAFTTSRRTGRLDDLIAVPDPLHVGGDADGLARLIAQRHDWQRARLSGPLARQQREKIVVWFNDHITAAVCGARWVRGEHEIMGRAPSPAVFEPLRHLVGHTSLAGAIQQNFQTYDPQTAAGRRWFAARAGAYGVCSDTGLCDFAILWASDLSRLVPLCGPHLSSHLRRALAAPVLMRAARLFILLWEARGADAQVRASAG